MSDDPSRVDPLPFWRAKIAAIFGRDDYAASAFPRPSWFRTEGLAAAALYARRHLRFSGRRRTIPAGYLADIDLPDDLNERELAQQERYETSGVKLPTLMVELDEALAPSVPRSNMPLLAALRALEREEYEIRVFWS